MARDFALGQTAPLSQQDMLSQLFGGGGKREQAVLQLQEIVKRTVLGGESQESATRAVTTGISQQQAIAMAIAAMKHVPVVVQIDGTPVARASANAPAHRTRPGGL